MAMRGRAVIGGGIVIVKAVGAAKILLSAPLSGTNARFQTRHAGRGVTYQAHSLPSVAVMPRQVFRLNSQRARGIK
jgi:gas vesicle protein